MNNVKHCAPPEGYYEMTKNRKPSPFLVRAVKLLNTPRKTALDFGCGAGSETKLLLEQGFTVTAVDGNSDAADYIRQLPHQDRIRFICSPFEEFTFDSYDLINSSKSLPFAHKDVFNNMMGRLLISIKRDGIFVGEFFGINDQWNIPSETMTFLNKHSVKSLFEDMEIIELEEDEYDGKIANGKPKHWHTLHVIARKT